VNPGSSFERFAEDQGPSLEQGKQLVENNGTGVANSSNSSTRVEMVEMRSRGWNPEEGADRWLVDELVEGKEE